MEHIGRPVPNLIMLAGLAAFTGLVHLPALITAMQEHFPGSLGTKNAAAATAAYELVSASVGVEEAAVAHAD